MLDNMVIYLMFGMRSLIMMTIVLVMGVTLFVYFIPDSYILNNGVVNLQPVKKILFFGFLIVVLTAFVKIWHKDYKRQYIPQWLR